MTAKMTPQLERKQRDTKSIGPDDSDNEGPKRKAVDRPDTKDVLKRMRRVDKDQSKRYRQRAGE